MNNLSISLQVKQKVFDKFLIKALMFLGSFRLLKPETFARILTKRIQKGAFKYRAGKGKWTTLKIDREIVVKKS